jgi:hypothetical protein
MVRRVRPLQRGEGEAGKSKERGGARQRGERAWDQLSRCSRRAQLHDLRLAMEVERTWMGWRRAR